MGKHDWTEVSKEHVLAAIQQYVSDPSPYTRSKSTFLVYEGVRYPAKAIRGIAFQLCHGVAISSDDFAGGTETVRFFERLGFDMVHETTSGPTAPRQTGERTRRTSSPSLDKRTQKHALQRLLQRRYGVVIAEMTFDWLRVPAAGTMDMAYQGVYEALRAYRGHERFSAPSLSLAADFYVEDLGIVIEYDEDQHFSLARKAALEQYPPDLAVGFSIAAWTQACDTVRASDPTPPTRDETRAFYDTVRDFEVTRHGLTLIRLRHGDVDWTAPDAAERLEALISAHTAGQSATRPTSALNPASGVDWRALEIEFQRIRLNYLKWFFHFTPPQTGDIPGCGAGDGFVLLQADNGRGFTLFPCGFGAVYVGSGRGSVGLPASCFNGPAQLQAETRALRSSLTTLVHAVRDHAEHCLDAGDIDGMWSTLLNYFWLKVGAHEYAHDVTYAIGGVSDMREKAVRDYLVEAMQYAILPQEIPAGRFSTQQLQHFLRHGLAWNRFACCAYDCGPITLGQPGYVPYETVAQTRRAFLTQHPLPNDALPERRAFARAAIADLYNFHALYDEAPLSLVWRYSGFVQHRPELRTLIAEVQEKINGCVASEHLNLTPFGYVPA